MRVTDLDKKALAKAIKEDRVFWSDLAWQSISGIP